MVINLEKEGVLSPKEILMNDKKPQRTIKNSNTLNHKYFIAYLLKVMVQILKC